MSQDFDVNDVENSHFSSIGNLWEIVMNQHLSVSGWKLKLVEHSFSQILDITHEQWQKRDIFRQIRNCGG